jgi:hypothetical protein
MFKKIALSTAIAASALTALPAAAEAQSRYGYDRYGNSYYNNGYDQRYDQRASQRYITSAPTTSAPATSLTPAATIGAAYAIITARTGAV